VLEQVRSAASSLKRFVSWVLFALLFLSCVARSGRLPKNAKDVTVLRRKMDRKLGAQWAESGARLARCKPIQRTRNKTRYEVTVISADESQSTAADGSRKEDFGYVNPDSLP
jgi:hypothetical protein